MGIGHCRNYADNTWKFSFILALMTWNYMCEGCRCWSHLPGSMGIQDIQALQWAHHSQPDPHPGPHCHPGGSRPLLPRMHGLLCCLQREQMSSGSGIVILTYLPKFQTFSKITELKSLSYYPFCQPNNVLCYFIAKVFCYKCVNLIILFPYYWY